jgi:hypothetical protein
MESSGVGENWIVKPNYVPKSAVVNGHCRAFHPV